MKLHAHYESSSVDCDGRMDRSYVISPNDDERASEFGDLEFKERVLGNVVSVTGLGGTLTVTTFEDGTARLSWGEQTDEGSRSVEATFCEDDCDDAEYSQRDHSAEAMGY